MRRAGMIALLLVLIACSKSTPPGGQDPSEPEPVSITHWTDQTELFAEYPPLVPGRKSRFAIHLTSLADFKPISDGRVEVLLRYSDGRVARFTVDSPSRPGIFGVDVVIDKAGRYQLSIGLASRTLHDIHELGEVITHASEQEAAAAESKEHPAESITFLKEQQWTLDFATELVRERALRESIRVGATIEPRTGGVAEVTVPFTARLASSGDLPPIGTSVKKGQVLGRLIPPTSNPADLPALELARAEAQAALELARKDRARLERLLATGAVPLRRLEEARAVEATAVARLKAAETRIAQYEATRAAADDPSAVRLFLLRAPISGVIAETHATSGANVEAGENLFKIVDVDSVYVVGYVSESYASRLRGTPEAELEFPGISARRPAGRLVSIGRLVDPQSRTVKLIYEFNNRDRFLAVGQSGFLRIFMSPGVSKPSVPESAIVDDGGRPVVFVQIEGEEFVRRPVTLANREGGYVQVLEGVGVGERAVTRGAHLVRLAALSTQVPAHGHVH